MNKTSPVLLRDIALAALAAASAAVIALVPASAQTVPSGPAKAEAAEADKAGACELRVATGPAGKGFSRLYGDMARVCSARVRLCEVRSEGGLSNLTHLAANEADLGFAPVDTFGELKASDPTLGALQAVMPVNANLLHVVVQREGWVPPPPPQNPLERVVSRFKDTPAAPQRIEKLSQLRGKPVALVGSAQQLVRGLDRDHRLGLQIVDLATDAEALQRLRKGEFAAVLSTSGWPHGAIRGLGPDSGLALAGLDLAPTPPAVEVTRNYANLGAYRVKFLASPNLLLTRPFRPDGAMGRRVGALQKCMAEQLETLREGAYEPSWQEVTDLQQTYGVPRFGGRGRP
jgi:hypothetical protein